MFFHPRADWLRRTLPAGQRRIVSGRVEIFDGIAQMAHPDHVLRPGEAEALPAFEPVYPLTQGLTLKTMTRAVRAALARAPALPEWIEPSLKRRARLARLARGARRRPRARRARPTSRPPRPARERLAYDELLAHQVTLAIARAEHEARQGLRHPRRRPPAGPGARRPALRARPAPRPARVAEITADMASACRMNRLLQGDVGSGKTLVAFLAMLAAVEAGGQAALMAPTEILARQHLLVARAARRGRRRPPRRC